MHWNVYEAKNFCNLPSRPNIAPALTSKDLNVSVRNVSLQQYFLDAKEDFHNSPDFSALLWPTRKLQEEPQTGVFIS